MEPFWEAFWRQFGAKLANYTHFGQLWRDFGPLRAIKFKMQIRLDKKCSFGEAAVGRVGGRGQATGALTGWLWTVLAGISHCRNQQADAPDYLAPPHAADLT